MLRSLSSKLLLAFLAVSLTGTVISGFVAVFVTAEQFGQYVVTQEQAVTATRLSDYYAVHGSWEGVMELFQFRRGPGMGPRGGGPADMVLVADQSGTVVLPGMGFRLGERVPADQLERGIPLTVNDDRVGTLLLPGGDIERAPAGNEFLGRINNFLILGAAGGTLVALLLGVLLARTLSQPLREMKAATQAVARGELGQEVPVRSRDELGELAAAFNQMSRDLERASQSRKQMTADIAHDLRTPLSVILGYTESLSDGVLEGDPETYAVMHREAQQLNRLIDDLRTLSLADAGELSLAPERVAPADLLQQSAAAYGARAARQEIAMRVNVEPGLPAVYVDEGRISQVLGNLLSNGLRYTPAGGELRLGARRAEGDVLISVTDTGAGIPADSLPYVFDRSFRGDISRRQQNGESGLGLAIARSIVEAHGGTIGVESTVGKGTTFTIRLPAAEEVPDSAAHA